MVWKLYLDGMVYGERVGNLLTLSFPNRLHFLYANHRFGCPVPMELPNKEYGSVLDLTKHILRCMSAAALQNGLKDVEPKKPRRRRQLSKMWTRTP